MTVNHVSSVSNVIPVNFKQRKRAPMRRLESASFTHVGRVRDKNEDRFFVDEDMGLFVVCDGLGGHAAGEIAAQLTVDTIAFLMAHAPKPVVPNDLQQAVEGANRRVYERSLNDPSCRGMGTTIVAALVLPPNPALPPGPDSVHVAVVHTGDSRLSVGHRSLITLPGETEPKLHTRLFPLTEDHEEDGMLTHAIGMGPDVHCELRVFSMDPGDTMLLYSDGLYREVDNTHIMRRLCSTGTEPRPVQEIADHLVRDALANGGRDNVTGIVVRV